MCCLPRFGVGYTREYREQICTVVSESAIVFRLVMSTLFV